MAVQTQTKDALIKLLNDLIELDFDAIQAYQAAIDRLQDSLSREKLGEFMLDHERHTRELGQAVSTLGGVPAMGGDLKQILTKGRVLVGTLLGDARILAAMKANEDDTNRAYERAAAQNLPQDLRAIIEANLADERRHRAFIEQRMISVRESASTTR